MYDITNPFMFKSFQHLLPLSWWKYLEHFEAHTSTKKDKIQTQIGLKERLFLLTRTHCMQIFGEIHFVKPQNDT